jgi:hypothetical protein
VLLIKKVKENKKETYEYVVLLYDKKNKITIPKNNIFIYPPSLFLSFPSSSIPLSAILSLFCLYSIFLPVPFSPSLSFRYIHSTCARLFLSSHSTFCIFFSSFHPLESFSSFPHLNLVIIFLHSLLTKYTSHISCCICVL